MSEQRRAWHRYAVGAFAALILLLGAIAWNRGTGPSRRAHRTDSRVAAASADERNARVGAAHARGESEPASKHEPPLADVFFGPVKLSFLVVDQGGRPVAGARVEVVPENFQPSRQKEWARFSGETDQGGVVVFDRFPVAPHYVAMAMTRGAYGASVVRSEERIRAPVKIVVKTLYYQRIRVQDEAGDPVSTDGHAFTAATSWVDRLRRMGVSLDERKPGSNELLVTHDSAQIVWTQTSNGPKEPVLTIHLPGYEPVDVPEFRFALASWPKAKTVTVRSTRGPARIARYRVALPNLDPLRARMGELNWRVLHLRVNVRSKSSVDTHVMTRDAAEFLAAPGLQFEAWLDGLDTVMECSVRKAEGGFLVEPHYPPLAIVRLTYPIPTRGDPLAGRLRVLAFPSKSYAGRILWPGATLLGPMPAGEYTLVRVWKTASGQAAMDRWGPQEFGPGFHDIEWP